MKTTDECIANGVWPDFFISSSSSYFSYAHSRIDKTDLNCSSILIAAAASCILKAQSRNTQVAKTLCRSFVLLTGLNRSWRRQCGGRSRHYARRVSWNRPEQTWLTPLSCICFFFFFFYDVHAYGNNFSCWRSSSVLRLFPPFSNSHLKKELTLQKFERQ